MNSGFDLQKIVSDPWSEEEQSSFFLKLCENLIYDKKDLHETEEKLYHYSNNAAKLSPFNPEILFRIASYFYAFGIRTNEKRFIYSALDKILEAFALDPTYFEKEGSSNLLWAQILMALSIHLDDETFLIGAIKKYELAFSQFRNNRIGQGRVLWESAKAYHMLAKSSLELQDCNECLQRYVKASHIYSQDPTFWLDYGISIGSLGTLFGNIELLRSSLEFFRKTLSMKVQKPVQKSAWMHLLEKTKAIALYTGESQDFDAADQLFQTTILNYPDEAPLWLKWGDLFLKEGWRLNNIQYIERGIEKITSLKSNDCDPILKRILLAEGLLSLGYILDDFFFIQEGLERLKDSHGIEEQKAAFLYAKGFSYLISGLYFSDERYFSEALFFFEKGLENEPNDFLFLSGVAESHISWATLTKDEELFKKGFQTLERLHFLFPFSAHFLDEWGVALLKLYQHHPSENLLFDALDKFKKALKLHDEPEISFHYGIALDLTGQSTNDDFYFSEAISVLNSVLELAPEFLKVSYHLALSYLHYGELLFDTSHLSKAVDIFESVIRRLPADEASHGYKGKALLVLSTLTPAPNELLNRAEFHLLQALNLGSKEAAFDLACLYSLADCLDKSLVFLKKCSLELEKILNEKRLEKVISTEGFKEFLKERSFHG